MIGIIQFSFVVFGKFENTVKKEERKTFVFTNPFTFYYIQEYVKKMETILYF